MKKFFKFIGILLLVVILIIAAACVWLFSANKKMDFQCDDISAFINAAPMTDGERYSFSADDDTMTMALDKSDIYWYLTQEFGEDIFDEINSELNERGVILNGVAMTLAEEEIILEVKVGYAFVTLNARIPCSLSYDDSKFYLQPEGLIAFGIDIASLVDYDMSEFCVEIPYDHLMLYSIDRMNISDGCVKLTGEMTKNYMGMAREGFTAEELETMLDDDRCSYAAQILYKYAENPKDGKHCWMSILEKEPALFTTVFEQLFSMISPETFGGFHITELNYGMIFRFIPSYSPLAYQDNYMLLAADYKLS